MEASIDLHVHPFLGDNGLIDIVEAMNKADLDVAALESLDCSLYPLVLSEAAKFYPNPVADEAGLKLPDGKYLLVSIEKTALIRGLGRMNYTPISSNRQKSL